MPKGARGVRPPKKSKWEQRNIVAWDGEGANLADGTHIYNLVANSNGRVLQTLNPKGLSTVQVLNFFLNNTTNSAINVIYGGSYDVNMFLKDLPESAIESLWKKNSVKWRGFKISYTPRKRFSVTRIHGSNKKFVLWDVLGYFQTSFVKACAKWLVDAPMLDRIQTMKNERSVFSVERLPEIREYNRMECELLVLLVQALFRAMDTANIVLTRYDGAGSIAAALLRTNRVNDYMGDVPGLVYNHAQLAYSGGRIEAPMIGNEDSNDARQAGQLYGQSPGASAQLPTTDDKPDGKGQVSLDDQVDSVIIGRADINSAYPAAARELPSYRGATWSVDPTWDGQACSMAAVTFDFQEDAPFYPCFYRQRDGTILYPRRGRGVYFGSEIRNLFDYYCEGRDFRIEYAVNVTLGEQHKPFGFIDDVYAIRLGFKSVGDMAHEALKLGMNSIYGKLAQQEGYSVAIGNDGHGRARYPAYHHLLWAGQITSITRANLFRAAMDVGPEKVAAFATDAVICKGATSLQHSTDLGGWSVDSFDGATIVQAGVYWLKEGNQWGSKYRGFDPGSLRRDEILMAWNQYFRRRYDNDPMAGKYEATLTRFIGMGSALARTDGLAKIWRTWLTDTRLLDTIPQGKRRPDPGHMQYYRQLERTLPAINYTPDEMSTAFPIVWVDGFKELRPTLGGVDIRIVEEEWEDSNE